MNDRPHAAELLNAAREAVAAEMLPALPEALRYTGLMIANALAIAAREIEAGDTPVRAEYLRLCTLLTETPQPLAGDALREAVGRHSQRLARDIRAGTFDGEAQSALLEHLRQSTVEKLAVSNPKALQRR